MQSVTKSLHKGLLSLTSNSNSNSKDL